MKLHEFLLKIHANKYLQYLYRMKQLDVLRKQLKPGHVYRRADLQPWSNAIDRHLHLLVAQGEMEKLSGGLYYVSKQSVFGNTPATDEDLIKAFLKDEHFLIMSPNDYNTLGVGTTQLYNTRYVYNYKRHGDFKLGNRTFRFIRKPYVPSKITPEFLLVDLVNNLKHLSEDQDMVLEKVKEKALLMDKERLTFLADRFGTVSTRKLFSSLLKVEDVGNVSAQA